MKKAFKLLAIAFAALSLGTVMTSCGEDENIIDRILNWFKGGETYTYTGKGEVYTMDGLYSTSQWTMINDSATTVTDATVTMTVNSQTINLALPNMTDGKATIQDVVLYNLVPNNTDATKTRFDFGESTSIDGKLIIGDKTYETKNLYIEDKTTYVTTTDIVLELSIYFDDDDDNDYEKVVNFTYTGAVVTQ